MPSDLPRFHKSVQTASELRRVKTQSRANFIRGIERIGGFGGKSDVLARNEVFTGSADHYLVTERRIAAATAGDFQTVAARRRRAGAWGLPGRPPPPLAAPGRGAAPPQVAPPRAPPP